MATNVVIKNRVQAMNIDTYNRTAIATVDIENGSVFKLDTYSTTDGEGTVWNATAAGDVTAKGLWMATSPEVVITKDAMGNEYKGLTPDPRAFINGAGRVIDVTFLAPHDIIEMTGANIANIATNGYLIPDATGFALASSATAGTGFTLKKIGTGILHIGNAGLVKVPVTTYKFEVVNN